MDRSVRSPKLERQRYIHERGGEVHELQIDRVIQSPVQIPAKPTIAYPTIRVVSVDRDVLEVNIHVKYIRTHIIKVD